MKVRIWVWALLAAVLIAATPAAPAKVKIYSVKKKGIVTVERVVKSDAEWQKVLTPEQFRITRKAGTEIAFTGKYWNNHAKGIYRCVCCGTDLFSSDTKFESGTGWPSFTAPIAKENVAGASESGAEPRPCAPVAAPTWGTCSTTDRSRPACATA